MTVDENYFTEKYGLTRTHSEVLLSADIVKPGKTLDLGCGNGRNSLYLAANGYDVTAWDKNPMSIDNIERIKAAEGIANLETAIKDLNNLTFDGEYDFILSTVVLMFLEANTIPGLIANMQRCTRPGGYNLIVAAMDTEDYPCTVGFPFAFKTGELSNYYEGWELIKYNEEVGNSTVPMPTGTVSSCASLPCSHASPLNARPADRVAGPCDRRPRTTTAVKTQTSSGSYGRR